MLETDDKLVPVRCNRVFRGHEAALLAGRLFDVVLLIVRRRDLETHAERRVAFPGHEGVGGVVVGRLHIILVRIGPVQLHFLAVIGNEIGRLAAAGIAAQRHEITFLVIAVEEVEEIAVNIGLGFGVYRRYRQLLPEFDNPGRFIGGDSQGPRGRHRLVEFRLERLPLLVGHARERFLHLRQQIPVEERLNLARLHVHDAVEAEIQIAPVELEHLPQQVLEAVEVPLGLPCRPVVHLPSFPPGRFVQGCPRKALHAECTKGFDQA